MANCNEISCLSDYSCFTDNIITLQNKDVYGDGAIYMPYAELIFGDNKITLGNQSSPPVNHAAIASFQYGVTGNTTGLGVEMEIIDHAGTMYPQIISALNKTVSRTIKDNIFSFDFGWVIKKCDGTTKKILFSDIHRYKPKLMATSVVPIIEGNNVKLKVSLSHSGGRWSEAPLRINAIANEEEKVTLKEAIKKIFTECDPKFKDVIFYNKEKTGPFYFTNETEARPLGPNNGSNGPKACWEVKSEPSLSVVRRWLNDHKSQGGHGFVMYYSLEKEAMIIQEYDQGDMKCNRKNHRGTFIVNGGKCSPVIRFNPEFKWGLTGSPGVGGASAGAASGQNNQEIGNNPAQTDKQKAGTGTKSVTPNMNWQWVMPEFATEEKIKGMKVNIESNSLYELPGAGAIEATLEIIGNPMFGDPIKESGANYVSIILINPFRIKNEQNKCGWAITNSNCNPTVSNKGYLIKGVSHSISSGSFVTTLQLIMLSANVQKKAKDPDGIDGQKHSDQEVGKAEATDTETGC